MAWWLRSRLEDRLLAERFGPQFETYVIEIDRESVDYLKLNFPVLEGHILAANFLTIRPDLLPTKQPDSTELFAVIGNFPYNISSQILFKVLENE